MLARQTQEAPGGEVLGTDRSDCKLVFLISAELRQAYGTAATLRDISEVATELQPGCACLISPAVPSEAAGDE
jgi:hypothetical protein